MFKVFILQHDVNYLTLVNDFHCDFDLIFDHVGEGIELPPSNKLMKFSLGVEDGNDRRVVGDYPCYSAVYPILSVRAYEVLNKMLEPHCQTRWVTDGVTKYSLVNVLTKHEIIDYAESDVNWFSNYPSYIRRVVCKIQSFEPPPIFRDAIDIRGNIYVSEKFKEVVESNNLLGFEFERVL